MFSASSNQHRDRRPNHLLQWTGMRWAKSHGCTLYDFRAIAEKLEPTEPDYSLYTYKEGFGGYSVLTLEGHDLPYNLPLYLAYRQSLALKRALVRRRFARRARERERAAERRAPSATASATSQPADPSARDAEIPAATISGAAARIDMPSGGTRNAE